MKKIIITLFLTVNSLLIYSQSGFGDIIGIWDTINFESPCSYISIDTSIQNIWHVGTPQKIIFNSAFSQPYAMVTDTINTYPINNHSYFDLYLGAFNVFFSYNSYLENLFIDFWYKIDTDTLKDGGFISVSWDMGQTWTNIIEDMQNYAEVSPANPHWAWDQENLYSESDTLFNGEYGFSGSPNEWNHTVFSWHWLYVKDILDIPPDTMILRFNFISDSIDNSREGWLIDSIRIYSVDIGDGTHGITNNSELLVSPNPAEEFVNISFGNSVSGRIVIFDLRGKEVFRSEIEKVKNLRIDTGEIPSGVYIVKVVSENSVMSAKFIVD